MDKEVEDVLAVIDGECPHLEVGDIVQLKTGWKYSASSVLLSNWKNLEPGDEGVVFHVSPSGNNKQYMAWVTFPKSGQFCVYVQMSLRRIWTPHPKLPKYLLKKF